MEKSILEKSFDGIWHERLGHERLGHVMQKLTLERASCKLSKSCKELNERSFTVESAFILFYTTFDVRQGSISTVLLNIFLENTWNPQKPPPVHFHRLPRYIPNQRFANDKHLMAGAKYEMKVLINKRTDKRNVYGMEISADKKTIG